MISDPAEDRAKLEREVRVHKRLRELLLLFSRGGSASLGLTAALEALTPEIREIAGARSVEIWLHDRRNRQLCQAATSAGQPGDARVAHGAVRARARGAARPNGGCGGGVGLKRADIMGRPLCELVGPDTPAYVEAADPGQGIVPAVQRRVDDPALDGTFLLTATPLTSQDGHTLGRVLVARDITRQTRLEAERAALRERLTQSEKLASLRQFV